MMAQPERGSATVRMFREGNQYGHPTPPYTNPRLVYFNLKTHADEADGYIDNDIRLPDVVCNSDVGQAKTS